MEARVLDELGHLHHPVAEAHVLPLVLDGDEYRRAVAGREGAIGLNHRVAQARASDHVTRVVVTQQRHRHPVGHGPEHGQLDRPALAGALARIQGLENRRVGIQSRADVAGGHADAARRLRRAGDGAQPALGLHQHVVGLHLARRGPPRRSR